MNPKPATGVNQGVASAADLYLSNLTRRKPNGWLTPTASTGQYVYCVLQYLRSSPASSALMLLPRRRGITSSTITSSASSCSCNILSQRRGCSSTLLQTASTCYSHSSKLRAHISVASRGISTRVYIPAETAASLRCPYVPLPLTALSLCAGLSPPSSWLWGGTCHQQPQTCPGPAACPLHQSAPKHGTTAEGTAGRTWHMACTTAQAVR